MSKLTENAFRYGRTYERSDPKCIRFEIYMYKKLKEMILTSVKSRYTRPSYPSKF